MFDITYAEILGTICYDQLIIQYFISIINKEKF